MTPTRYRHRQKTGRTSYRREDVLPCKREKCKYQAMEEDSQTESSYTETSQSETSEEEYDVSEE